MENNFAKIMTELRRQKGITQKQAAMSLGVSQALLSHYEKGVRECGLDFLIRAAEFYGVSCDTLLGISDVIDNNSEETADNPDKTAIIKTLDIIYDLIDRCGSEAFADEVSDFIMLAVYRILRQLCKNDDADNSIFGVSRHKYRAMADAAMQVSEAGVSCTVNEQAGSLPLPDPNVLNISNREFSLIYKNEYKSLLRLIKKAENKMTF